MLALLSAFGGACLGLLCSGLVTGPRIAALQQRLRTALDERDRARTEVRRLRAAQQGVAQ